MSNLQKYKEIYAKGKDLFFANSARYGGGKGPNLSSCKIAHMLDLVGIEGRTPRAQSKGPRPKDKVCKQKQVIILYDAFGELGIPRNCFASVVKRILKAPSQAGGYVPSDGHIAFTLNHLASKLDFLCEGISPETCTADQMGLIQDAFDRLQLPYTG